MKLRSRKVRFAFCFDRTISVSDSAETSWGIKPLGQVKSRLSTARDGSAQSERICSAWQLLNFV